MTTNVDTGTIQCIGHIIVTERLVDDKTMIRVGRAPINIDLIESISTRLILNILIVRSLQHPRFDCSTNQI